MQIERPAAKRGLDLGKELRLPKMDEEARKALFGQTAQSVRAGAHYGELSGRPENPRRYWFSSLVAGHGTVRHRLQ